MLFLENPLKLIHIPNNFVRNNFIPILNKQFYNNFPPNSLKNKIFEWLCLTKKFINDHPDILITMHKDNVTVALDKNIYISKMEEILFDVDTYQRIQKDPIKKLTQDSVLLTRWKYKEFIEVYSTYRRLLTTDGNIPRTYGLIKIHKAGNPLRVIVSSLNSPLYYL